jgi:hypothetical protein
MPRRRQPEWTGVKIGAQDVKIDVKTDAITVRIVAKHGAAAEANPKAPAPVPAQNSSVQQTFGRAMARTMGP